MKRFSAFLLLLAALAGCLAGDPYVRLAKKLTDPLVGQKRRLAVLPFRGLDPALNAEGEAMSERLLSRLYGRGGIELIERSRLQQVMSEMSLGATGALDRKSVKELGRLSGAEALVLGTVVRGQRGLELAARVVDVESGRLLAAAAARLPTESNVARLPAPVHDSRPAPPVPARAPAPSPAGADLGPGNRLPWPASAAGSEVLDGRLYVAGGTTPRAGRGLGDPAVVSAPVSQDGRLGRWRAETPLPEGRYQTAVVPWGGRLYVLGGYHGSPRREVFVADKDGEGRLGAWRLAGGLPAGCADASARAIQGHLHVAGCSASDGPTGTLDSAPIREDGSLGPWRREPLPRRLFAAALAGTPGGLYVVGGALPEGGYADSVYFARLGKDGLPGEFRLVRSLPTALGSNFSATASGRLWVAAGHTNGQGPSGKVYSAVLHADGSLGAWRAAGTLSPLVGMPAAVAVAGGVVVLGGEVAKDGPTDAVQMFRGR